MAEFDFVTLEEFGAMGNGTDDDTAALVGAVATGRPIHLLQKTYLLSPVTITSSVSVRGVGPRSILKWNPAADALALLKFQGGGLTVSFRELTIDGNHQGFTDDATYRSSLLFQATADPTRPDETRLELYDVRFINGRSYDVQVIGKQILGATTKLRARGVRFTGGLEGTAAKSAQCMSINDDVDIMIDGVEMIGPTANSLGRAGIVVQQSDGHNHPQRGKCTITNVVAQDMGYAGPGGYLGAVDIYSGVDQVILDNIRCTGCFGRAVNVKADQSQVIVSNVHVGSLRSVDNACAVYFVSCPTLTAGRAAVLKGITVLDCHGTGLFVDGGQVANNGSRYHGIVVSDINIQGCTSKPVHLRNFKHLVLDGYFISGGGGGAAGITVSTYNGSTGGTLHIGNGIVEDAASDGLSFQGEMSELDVVVDGAVFSGFTESGIRLPALRSFQIRNSTIDGRGQGKFGVNMLGDPTNSSAIEGCNVHSVLYTPVLRKVVTLIERFNRWSPSPSVTDRKCTIADGIIRIIGEWHKVDTEGGAASDELTEILGGYDGQFLTLQAFQSTHVVILKNGVNNLRLVADRTLSSANNTITLRRVGATWIEVSFF